MKKIDLQFVLWKEGKYFVAQCLNLEVSSFGKSKKEALANLNEALELYFEDCKNTCRITKISEPTIIEQSFCHA